MQQSVIDTIDHLKNLKISLITNDAVYGYLQGKYGDKLKKNVDIFYGMLTSQNNYASRITDIILRNK
jgi:hypothetical protein